jgi:hypothetical protein
MKVNCETRKKLGQSAKRNAAVRWQAGRGAPVAGRRLPARFCGRSRADLLLERQSTALLPSCARLTIYPEGQIQKSSVLSSCGGSYC